MSDRPRRGLPASADDQPPAEPDVETTAMRRALREETPPGPSKPPDQAGHRPSRAATEPEPPARAPDPPAATPETRAAPRRRLEPVPPPVPSEPEHEPLWPRIGAAATAWGASASAGIRRRGLALASGLFGLIACLGAGFIPARPVPPPQTAPLVTAISRTCPVPDAGPASLLAASLGGDISMRALGSSTASVQSGPLSLGGLTSATVLTPALPQGGIVGGTVMPSGTQQWYGSCRPPRTDQYVQLPGGSGAKLLVINPEPEDALVDVTLTGPNGEITGSGLRGLTIPAGSQHIVDLSAYAGSVDALGARVRANPGRVLAVAQAARSDGGDFANGTVLGRTVVIPAVPEGSGTSLLLLSNPGTTRTAVSIEAVTGTGRHPLTGFESYTLNAQRTVRVDLTAALNGAPAALVVTGRDDFAASLFATMRGDFAIVPGELDQQSARPVDLVAVVPGPGVLQIANPAGADAQVSVDWGDQQAAATRTVAAGSVATIGIPSQAGWVRLSADQPVLGVLFVAGKDGSGLAAVPLERSPQSQAPIPMQPDAGMGR